ncbi:phospholipase D/nuclease [Testicularia cyperi]|uniref:Phospholipase D/nuclease n=1 Tax=Testicularia cyperi TaxID=1882483 RepID=A0A317XSF8_9BASI|nr:phospholipase D/nuclease [Testicularia cyperi]
MKFQNEPIVISDSDSDTLSESERPSKPPTSAKNLAAKNESRAEPKERSPRTLSQGSSAKEAEFESDLRPYTSPQASTLMAVSNLSEPSSSLGPIGLRSLIPDRAEMERERRERVRKRRRDQGLASESSEDESPLDTKKLKMSQDPTPQPMASTRSSQASQQSSSQSGTSTSVPNSAHQQGKAAPRAVQASMSMSGENTIWESATTPISPTSRYWHGTVKHGFNRYAARDLCGSTFGSMLLPATASSRNGLQFAVLATYDKRMDWLYAHFPRGVPVTLVLSPDKGDYRSDPRIPRPGLHPTSTWAEYAHFTGWKICVPNKPKGGWLTQHIKLLLLVHESFLRVAILSGNLNEIDWDRIENTAFVQDFPLIGASATPDSIGIQTRIGVNDFKPQLLQVLRSFSIPTQHSIFSALDRFDFTKATRARIVASWPEASVLAGWDRIESQGLGRLGKVVRDFGITAGRGGLELECQGSSLANHDKKWLEHFHVLASGVDPRSILPFNGRPNEPHPAYYTTVRTRPGDLPPIKVVFPNEAYVAQYTVEGPEGALSFFGKAREFETSPIQKLYCNPQSRRGDVMIHAKSILALTAEGRAVVDNAFRAARDGSLPPLKDSTPWSPNVGERPIGWSYLGSSNFTRAAHGNIGGTTAKPTMSSLNWELGVMMPIYASEVERFGVEAECLRAIVYHRPVQAYGPEDTPFNNDPYLAAYR